MELHVYIFTSSFLYFSLRILNIHLNREAAFYILCSSCTCLFTKTNKFPTQFNRYEDVHEYPIRIHTNSSYSPPLSITPLSIIIIIILYTCLLREIMTFANSLKSGIIFNHSLKEEIHIPFLTNEIYLY